MLATHVQLRLASVAFVSLVATGRVAGATSDPKFFNFTSTYFVQGGEEIVRVLSVERKSRSTSVLRVKPGLCGLPGRSTFVVYGDPRGAISPGTFLIYGVIDVARYRVGDREDIRRLTPGEGRSMNGKLCAD